MKLAEKILMMFESNDDLRDILKKFGIVNISRGEFKLKTKPSISELESFLKSKLGKDYKRQSPKLWPSDEDGQYYFDYGAKTKSDLYLASYEPSSGLVFTVE